MSNFDLHLGLDYSVVEVLAREGFCAFTRAISAPSFCFLKSFLMQHPFLSTFENC